MKIYVALCDNCDMISIFTIHTEGHAWGRVGYGQWVPSTWANVQLKTSNNQYLGLNHVQMPSVVVVVVVVVFIFQNLSSTSIGINIFLYGQVCTIWIWALKA